jgi:hypothetical protein
LVRVLVLPWLLFGLFALGVALVPTAVARVPDGISGSYFWVGAWVMIGLVIDVLFAVYARQRLLHEFREVATTRIESRSGRRERAKAAGLGGVMTAE